jgi:hypothetical protein
VQPRINGHSGRLEAVFDAHYMAGDYRTAIQRLGRSERRGAFAAHAAGGGGLSRWPPSIRHPAATNRPGLRHKIWLTIR